MSTDLTPQQTFEAKIKDRIRDSIGDLIPDEVLAQMIEKAMQSMFFTRTEVHDTSYGYHTRTKVERASWFEDMVQTELKDGVKRHMDAWLEANQERLGAAIVDALERDGAKVMAGFLVSGIVRSSTNVTENLLQEFAQEITQRFELRRS